MSEIVLKMDQVSKKFRRGQLHDSLRDLIPSMAATLFKGRKGDTLGRQEFWALEDVSFEVRQGEALGIVGPNGSGKSTILKILTGIMEPTMGTKTVKGSLSALIEVGAGFHPDLTGRENIYLNGTILGMKKSQITSKLDEIIEFSGLSEFIDTPVKRYSSGMYARLGFAIACHVDPDILIVDEVLSVGDWAFQNKSMAKMRDVASSGATVIFVSHNLKAVTSLCNRVLYLDKGKVLASGAPEEVITAYIKRSTEQAKQVDTSNKDAFIESVSLRTERTETSTFKTGEKALIDVTIASRNKSKPLAVDIGLRDQNLYLFFHISSERLMSEKILLGSGDKKTVTFELDMHLAPGSYFLNVALLYPDYDQLLDHWAPAHTFIVHSDIDVKGVSNLYPKIISS